MDKQTTEQSNSVPDFSLRKVTRESLCCCQMHLRLCSSTPAGGDERRKSYWRVAEEHRVAEGHLTFCISSTFKEM